jgi:hypothetical protein
MNLNTEVKKLFNASNFSLRITLVVTEKRTLSQNHKLTLSSPLIITSYLICKNSAFKQPLLLYTVLAKQSFD